MTGGCFGILQNPAYSSQQAFSFDNWCLSRHLGIVVAGKHQTTARKSHRRDSPTYVGVFHQHIPLAYQALSPPHLAGTHRFSVPD